MSASGVSHAIEMAGTISVPRSMHRISTVLKGIIDCDKAHAISGIFDESVYAMDFLRLSKINRPSLTPFTMLAKLSSSKIISAASFDTPFP